MIMRDTFLRMLTDNEKNLLHLMMLEDTEAGYRAKIILLKDEGYTVPNKKDNSNHHDHNIRKWIHHRFNEKGIDDGIDSKKHNHKEYKFDIDIEQKVVDIASSNPREDYGLGFST